MDGFQTLPCSLACHLSSSTFTGLGTDVSANTSPLSLDSTPFTCCVLLPLPPTHTFNLPSSDGLQFLSVVPSPPSSLSLEAQSSRSIPTAYLALDSRQVCFIYDNAPSGPVLRFLFHRQCPSSSSCHLLSEGLREAWALSPRFRLPCSRPQHNTQKPGLGREQAGLRGQMAPMPSLHSRPILCDFGGNSLISLGLIFLSVNYDKVTAFQASQSSGFGED